jgi:hypothetical protein
MNAVHASLAVVVRDPSGAPRDAGEILGVISQAGLAVVLAKGLELFRD